ncbi:MAG: antitoxin [Treponema sp.]|jgi:predicted DNA binding CopG/RHH family protein|nr:antitoxin [Treponema sp.]
MTGAKYIDAGERAAIESLKNGEWESTKDLESWKDALSAAAANTLSKDQRMNIRITKNDLDGIKLMSVEEGLPYQTLVASILHKYIVNPLNKDEARF